MAEDADLWLNNRLSQMRDAALQAHSFVEGMELEAFAGDTRTHQACSLNLIVIQKCRPGTRRLPGVRWLACATALPMAMKPLI
jgi:uncharacterized protein with HEPN domain